MSIRLVAMYFFFSICVGVSYFDVYAEDDKNYYQDALDFLNSGISNTDNPAHVSESERKEMENTVLEGFDLLPSIMQMLTSGGDSGGDISHAVVNPDSNVKVSLSDLEGTQIMCFEEKKLGTLYTDIMGNNNLSARFVFDNSLVSNIDVANIVGVCSGGITVCNKQENKRLCSLFSNPSKSSSVVKQSSACYVADDGSMPNLQECMSWSFGIDNNNSLSLIPLAFSSLCPYKEQLGAAELILLQEKVRDAVNSYDNYNVSKMTSNNTNTVTEYYYSDKSKCDSQQRMNELEQLHKQDLTDVSMIKNSVSSSSAAQLLFTPTPEGVQEEIDNMSDSMNNELGSLANVIYDDNQNQSDTESCSTQTCTVETLSEEKLLRADGNTNTTILVSNREVLQCISNGYGDTSFTCPIDTSVSNAKIITECTCVNEDEAKEALRDSMLGVKLAEAVKSSVCKEAVTEEEKEQEKRNWEQRDSQLDSYDLLPELPSQNKLDKYH